MYYFLCIKNFENFTFQKQLDSFPMKNTFWLQICPPIDMKLLNLHFQITIEIIKY